jgi:signal transduction histidine kinase
VIDPRRAGEVWRRLDVTVRDLPLALLLAAAGVVPLLNGYGTQVGELPARPLDAGAVVVVALECLPLALRRRWPAVSLVLVSLGFAAQQLVPYELFAGNALAVALVSAGLHLERGRRTVPVVLSVAYVALAVGLDRLGSTERFEGFVTFYLAVVLLWGLGAWLRSARAAEAAERGRVEAATRATERTRIARELHDVVTHHVTAMVVQTEAARYLAGAPERLDETLGTVADTGRQAVADLRSLLDLLDPGHDGVAHAPSFDLEALVAQARRAGQPVELVVDGDPPEPDGGTGLVVYRVVQESLTNALKHAHGDRTTVRLRHDDRETTVEVGTDGPGPGAPGRGPGARGTVTGIRAPGAGPRGSGRGLAGLRGRVEALDGTLDAGPRDDGGFLVRARIPAPAPASVRAGRS